MLDSLDSDICICNVAGNTSAEMINYNMVDQVFKCRSDEKQMVMFCMKKHKIKMLRHIILHMATSGTEAEA